MQRTHRFTAAVAALAVMSLAPAAAGATDSDGPATRAELVPVQEATPINVTAAGEAEAGRSVVIFSGTSTATASSFWNVGHRGPGNLVQPVNYAGGNAVLKLQVLSKPSTKPLKVQVCMWRNHYRQETCSPMGTIVGKGSYTFNLGRPAGWWKKGSFSWSTPYQVTHIMVKDPNTGRLMMNRNCGAACYRGSDLNRHVSVRMLATLTFTAN